MSSVEVATVDARGRDTRAINQDIRKAIADGAPAIEVLHPGSRHNLAVGILEDQHSLAALAAVIQDAVSRPSRR